MSEPVTIPGSRGSHLTGVLHRAAAPKGGILMAHCFTCSKDLAVNSRLATALAAGGFHVLRFDFTGLGESGGDFERSTFVANVGDLVAAATWMIDRKLGPTVLVGHSLGGAAALIAARRIKPVKAVAVIGAPSRPDHVLHLIDEDAQAQATMEGCTFVRIAGRTFPLSNRFLADLRHYDSEHEVGSLAKPLLVLHSPDDEVVPIEEGERIFALASQPKSFWPIPGADHLLTNPSHTGAAAQLIMTWLDLLA